MPDHLAYSITRQWAHCHPRAFACTVTSAWDAPTPDVPPRSQSLGRTSRWLYLNCKPDPQHSLFPFLALFFLAFISIRFLDHITKYHKPDGLKQRKFILSQSWRLKVRNQGVRRAMPFSGALGEKPTLLKCTCLCSVASDSLRPPRIAAPQAHLSMEFSRQEC